MQINELLNKIEILETRQAFQEDTIESLNNVIIQQQKDVAELRLVVGVLQERVKQATDGHSDNQTEEPPPPHY